jgi:RHS repeat-associated protein
MKLTHYLLAGSLALSAVAPLSAEDTRRRELPTSTVTQAAPTVWGGFTAEPADSEFYRHSGLELPLLPTGETTPAENSALAAALTSYQSGGTAHDFTAIDAFLHNYPESSWKAGLLLNKGLAYRYNGFIGASFTPLEQAWELTKDAQSSGLRAYADRAVAELIAIKAGLGRQDELATLFAAIEARNFSGRPAELIANARLGVRSMENDPERSFNCGPAALVNVLKELGNDASTDPRIMAKPATNNGLSLKDVAGLADTIGFSGYRVAYRDQGEFQTPSIVHWNEGHFSAVLRKEGTRYLIQDPTLGRNMWVPEEALESEGSGYFLIAQSELPEGWRHVALDEAATIYGKGKTSLVEDGSTRPYDQMKDCGNNPGMPGYNVHLLLVSLNITDTPIWTNTPYGYPMAFTVRYNQRETSLPDPALAVRGSMGANWTHNWQSWADTDDTLIASIGYETVTLAIAGGGREVYELNTAQDAYLPQRDTQSVLTATFNGSTLTGYQLSMPNGSVHTYGLLQAASSPRFYLTAMADPYGNTVSLNYDSDYRLSSIDSDALPGAELTLIYAFEGDGSPDFTPPAASSPEDYLIKEVVGPQGRYASFEYDANYRIDGITDMIGLESGFGYGSSYVTSMTTPYGTTGFSYPTDNLSVSRALMITDTAGQQERFEFSREDVSGVLPVEATPTGASKGGHFLDDLNTFHWDKRAMETAVNPDGTMDYTQATIYHWMQADSQRASSVVHSIKRPLENRDWFIYSDSPDGGATIGSTNKPSAVKRFVQDEAGTIVERTIALEHNSFGNVTRSIDPVGREVELNYAPNGIDLINVKQRTGAGANDFATLSTFDYDEDNDGNDDFPRLPSLITGADGVRLDLTFNSNGQIENVTRQQPDGQGGYTDAGTTDYTYYPSGAHAGFLQKVEGPLLGGERATTTYTYDAYQRVETATDTDNFKLTYSYDDLDRITEVRYPDGSFVANIYEPVSEGLDMIGFIDRQGRLSQFLHDPVGRVVQAIDPKGQSTLYQWCGCGSLNSIIDPLGQATTWVRDIQGRVEEKIYADQTKIEYEYQPESGFLSKVTDQRGYDKEFKYFVDGNIQEVSFDDGGTADPDYIDAPTVTYTYDPYFNRSATLTTAGAPDDYAYQYYGFTGDGNANRLQTVTISKLRDGLSFDTDIDYAYDSLGRLFTRTFKGATETYTYDVLDRLDTLNDPLGDFDYDYEELTGRIASVQHSVSGIDGIDTQLGYQHKNAGGQERKVPYLQNIMHSTPSGLVSAHAYQRDLNGWIDLWQQFDGTDWQSHGYRYDQAGQLETARKFDGLDENSPLLESEEYRYDRAGNRILFKDTADQLNDGHNNLNQLTARTSEGSVLFHGTVSEPGKVFVQQLDGSNNVTQSVEADLYGGGEFYASLDLPVGTNTVRIIARDIHGETSTQDYSVPVAADVGDSFQHDAAGNLTHWTKADGTAIEYKWDAANRLRAIEVDSQLVQSFEYDGAGRMVRATSGGQSDDYYWAGLERLGRENVDASPTVYRRYLTQGFTESLDGAPPSKYFTLRDHLGSTREVLDGTYATVAKYDYSVWGEVTKLSGMVDADQLYTGHLYFADSDTPLHLAPCRAYQPELGRWMQRDPMHEYLGLDPEVYQGPNIYRYGFNDPVNNLDNNGLWVWHVVGAGVGAAFDIGAQLATNGGSITDINWGSVGVSAASGAVGVGLGANVARITTSITGRAVLNGIGSAGIGAVGQISKNAMDDCADIMDGVGASAVVSGGLGAAGSVAGDIAESAINSLMRETPLIEGLRNSNILTGGSTVPENLGTSIGTGAGVGISNAGPVFE